MLLVSRDYEGKQITALNPTSDAAHREHGALHVTLKQYDAALAGDNRTLNSTAVSH